MIDAAIPRALTVIMPRSIMPVLRALSVGPLCVADLDQVVLSGRPDLTPSSIRYALRMLSEAGLITRPRADLRIDGRKKITEITDLGRAVLAFLEGGAGRV
jgi:DNA-binding PadR family transcriptional regulator